MRKPPFELRSKHLTRRSTKVSLGPLTTRRKIGITLIPFGGRDRGREATLKTVRAVHQTFLKGVTETIEDIDVRFASEDVAVATVTSTSSPFTSPDGVKRGVARGIRTFVVVKRGGRWLIMQDQNTAIIESPH